MRHHQYRESLLERLRLWRLANRDATIADCRKEMRPTLSEDEINLLFDNWLNANFDRIELVEMVPYSGTATIKRRSNGPPPAAPPRPVIDAIVRPSRTVRTQSPEERAEHKRAQDAIVAKVVSDAKDNLYKDFAGRIWSTILPNGVTLGEATKADLRHTEGWYGEIAKRLKPGEKVKTRFSAKQLFDLSQRPKFSRVSGREMALEA